MSAVRTALFLLCPVILLAQADQTDQGAAEASYSGPSVLTRGGLPSISTFLSSIRFRPFVGVNGIYDSGLTRVALTPNGQATTAASEGVALNYGVYGNTRWRTTSLGLNFSGDFRHYSQATYYGGTDQQLSLQITHQLTKRWTFAIITSAGTYNYRFGYQPPTGFAEPTFYQNSTNSLFDNRTVFLQTAGRLVYKLSARWSLSFGGTGFITRRRSSALYGDTGYMANADASYRWSKYVTVGLYYSYSHYDFLRVFGGSDFHTVGVNLSMRLSKTWEFGVAGGVYRLENLLVQLVPVNPIVAEITGQTSTLAATYNLSYASTFNTRLSHSFHRGSCDVTYTRGVSPGNGVFLTSRADTVAGGCNYTALRYWGLNAGASYYALTAQVQSLSQYAYADFHITLSRTLRRGMSMVATFDVLNNRTHYIGIPTGYDFRGQIGFNYSPGERPLTLW